jgi:hypothetical protein
VAFHGDTLRYHQAATAGFVVVKAREGLASISLGKENVNKL